MSDPTAPTRRIDLNADVGEQVDPAGDGPLLELVSSASVACGGHAGDAEVMRRTCAAAAALGVRLGAHVSYADREGFGRRELHQPAGRIADDVVDQLDALAACARAEGAELRYVKPHGALYGRAGADAELATRLAAAIAAAVPVPLSVMTPPGSALATAAAQAGLGVIAEGFADRGYGPDGGLLPRDRAGALLDAQAAGAQAVRLGARGIYDSLCIHSDTPGAVTLARAVRDALRAAGVLVTAES